MRHAQCFKVPKTALSTLFLTTVLCGCGAIPTVPSVEEQRQTLTGAGLSPADRFAVVARASQVHGVTPYPLEAPLLSRIGRISAQGLGVQAVPIVQKLDEGWHNELKRAREEVGWFSAAKGYEEYFRQKGFDGYILVTLFQWEESRKDTAIGINHWGVFTLGPGYTNYYTYNPVFHIVHLPKGSEKATLAIVQPSGRIGCDLETVARPGKGRTGVKFSIKGYKDVEGCADRIAAKYAAGLRHRLGQ